MPKKSVFPFRTWSLIGSSTLSDSLIRHLKFLSWDERANGNGSDYFHLTGGEEEQWDLTEQIESEWNKEAHGEKCQRKKTPEKNRTVVIFVSCPSWYWNHFSNWLLLLTVRGHCVFCGTSWFIVYLRTGLAHSRGPVPPHHLHRLGQDASFRLQRAKQPRRRLPRHPNRQGNQNVVFWGGWGWDKCVCLCVSWVGVETSALPNMSIETERDKNF